MKRVFKVGLRNTKRHQHTKRNKRFVLQTLMTSSSSITRREFTFTLSLSKYHYYQLRILVRFLQHVVTDVHTRTNQICGTGVPRVHRHFSNMFVLNVGRERRATLSQTGDICDQETETDRALCCKRAEHGQKLNTRNVENSGRASVVTPHSLWAVRLL